MIFWSYTTIVKPILTYAAVAWWTKDRSSWNNPNLCIPSGSQVWYTDGSKLENGDTGAGVYGPQFRMSIAMGKITSIFQAEIHAIEACVIECIRRRMQGHTKEVIRNWEEKKLSKHWLDSVGQRQAKRLLIPAKNQSKRHCSLRYHLKKLNLSETDTCRFCELSRKHRNMFCLNAQHSAEVDSGYWGV
ncbi:hypothetical protein ACLKA6_012277 [Drosophila palustris]